MSKLVDFQVIYDSDRMPGVPSPHDIPIHELIGTAGMFGKHEIEVTAGKLVAFMQFKGRWTKFTLSELHSFYQRKGWNPDKMLAGLTGLWFNSHPLSPTWVESYPFLAFDFNGDCYVTDLFIKACMKK